MTAPIRPISKSGFGLEKLIGGLLATRPIYLLDRKGEDIRTMLNLSIKSRIFVLKRSSGYAEK